MKRVLIIAGVLAGIGGLAWYFYNQANLLMKYCFNFTGYKIITLSRDRITIEVRLQIKNKSDIDITLTGYKFEVFLNSAYASTIEQKKTQIIKANSFSELSLKIDVEPSKNKQLANWDFLSRLLLDVNNIRVRIKGAVSASALGISAKDVGVNLEMKLKEMLPDKANPTPPCK